MTVIGWLGVADTIRFYALDYSTTPITLGFYLHFGTLFLFLNMFAPGIIVGPGLRSVDMIARIAGLVLSLLWAITYGLQCVGTLVGFFFLGHGSSLVILVESVAEFVLYAALTAYSVWQFNVLRSGRIRELFEGP